ncbi:MAG TPA: helix-turn-helix domain-containing protein [Thermomicrobiales bacterium]|nr:helix-turn-helix domain-containing protein [Thermomicrobiales bacterium]
MVNMNGDHGHAAVCPLYHRAVELIGRRWTGAILRALLDGETRFSDLTQVVPGLSDRLLSERLKELETEGIVTRTVFPEIPVRIEYTLTEKGRALGDVMDAIGNWAHDWLAPDALVSAPEEPCLPGADQERDIPEAVPAGRA